MTGVLLAADLVTLEGRGWDALAAGDVLAAHQIRRRHLDTQAAERLRLWSIRLRPAFEACGVDARCATVNDLLEEGASRAYLTTHDQLKPHMHFTADDDDAVARVRAVTAGGLALFIVQSEGARLGICARPGCEVAFVDTSRNGLRAYCSPTCGNYVAVMRHRAIGSAKASSPRTSVNAASDGSVTRP